MNVHDTTLKELREAIQRHSQMSDEELMDAGKYGADAGWPGFTYYQDTERFFDANESLIWEWLVNEADALGYANVPAMIADWNRADMAESSLGFKCLVSWAVLEAVGRAVEDGTLPRQSSATV